MSLAVIKCILHIITQATNQQQFTCCVCSLCKLVTLFTCHEVVNSEDRGFEALDAEPGLRQTDRQVVLFQTMCHGAVIIQVTLSCWYASALGVLLGDRGYVIAQLSFESIARACWRVSCIWAARSACRESAGHHGVRVNKMRTTDL